MLFCLFVHKRYLQLISYRPATVLLQINTLLEAPLLPKLPELLLHALLHLVGQDDFIGNVEIAKLVLVVDAVAVLMPLGHTFARHRLDVSALNNLASFASEADNVGIQMCQVSGPASHPGLSEGEDFGPVEIVALAAEECAVNAIGVVVSGRSLFSKGHQEVTSNPVGAFVGFVFVRHARVAASATVNLEGHSCWLLLNTGTATGCAELLNGLATATAGVAAHLHLLEHAWGELLLNDANTVTTASLAVINLFIGTACTLTSLADVLPVPVEFSSGAVIEIAERNFDLDLDVVTARLARRVAKVAVTTKESAKHIKGIVTTVTTAIAAILYSLVAVSIVDLSCFGVA